jgi:hypothetical protein
VSLVIFHIPSKQMFKLCFKIGHDLIFPHPSKFEVHNYLPIRLYQHYDLFSWESVFEQIKK